MSSNEKKLEELTKAQRRMLDHLVEGTRRTGIPPTMRELSERLRIGTTAVRASIAILERKGYVRQLPRKARGLIVLHS